MICIPIHENLHFYFCQVRPYWGYISITSTHYFFKKHQNTYLSLRVLMRLTFSKWVIVVHQSVRPSIRKSGVFWSKSIIVSLDKSCCNPILSSSSLRSPFLRTAKCNCKWKEKSVLFQLYEHKHCNIIKVEQHEFSIFHQQCSLWKLKNKGSFNSHYDPTIFMWISWLLISLFCFSKSIQQLKSTLPWDPPGN